MSGTHDASVRERPAMGCPQDVGLDARTHERLWLEGYLDSVKNAPGGLRKRLVVYGSGARGDAGPESDVDVLVLVKDARDAAEHARELIHRGDAGGARRWRGPRAPRRARPPRFSRS